MFRFTIEDARQEKQVRKLLVAQGKLDIQSLAVMSRDDICRFVNSNYKTILLSDFSWILVSSDHVSEFDMIVNRIDRCENDED